MTNASRSSNRALLYPGNVPTFGELITRIQADASLSDSAPLQPLLSLRRLIPALDKDLDDVHAYPPTLLPLMKDLHPARIGLDPEAVAEHPCRCGLRDQASRRHAGGDTLATNQSVVAAAAGCPSSVARQCINVSFCPLVFIAGHRARRRRRRYLDCLRRRFGSRYSCAAATWQCADGGACVDSCRRRCPNLAQPEDYCSGLR